MKKFIGFEHGMGIGGWLTNYKRFNVLPQDRRLCLTIAPINSACEAIYFLTESSYLFIVPFEAIKAMIPPGFARIAQLYQNVHW